MQLKNYQEDIVLKAIDIALEERPELQDDPAAVNDVAAYVLNRLPPRYIMSERGFTRLAAEHLDEHNSSLGSMIGILVLVNQGIDVVTRRRKPSVNASGQPISMEEQLSPVHNLPQIFGKVVNAESGAAVHGASVRLSINGRTATPAEPGWPNPFVTQRSTNGYYSFWPAPVRDSSEIQTFTLSLDVDHPGYQPARVEKLITTCCEFTLQEKIISDGILSLDPIALRPA